MILAALEAEVEDCLEHHRALRDDRGHAQVVRNGKSRERTFTLGVGPLQFQAPRVNDRRGGHTFHSAVLPPCLRRSPRLETALPVLYLKSLATGDGALGFWAAWSEIYPQAREQRCWVHKTANVLDRLPKRLQPKAEKMLQEHAAAGWNVRSPDRQTLLTFYDFPAEHWVHLRTANPIESSFASVKARTRQTKGAGSRKAGLAMAYKLMLMAQDNWRKITAPHLLPLLRAGVKFKDGKQVQETPEAGKTTTVYSSPPWFEEIPEESPFLRFVGVS